MGMAAVIYEKGAPDNFVWEEIKVGSPERGQVRLRSTAVGVNFADTYHRAGIPHPMIVGDPPVVVGFEGVGEIEELGPGVTGFSVGERVCTCLPPIGAYSQERLYPADKLIKVPKDLPLDDVQLAGLILKGMAGITPDPIDGCIKAQTRQVLQRVDELLQEAGTDRSRLLSAQVWLADMRQFEDHNAVWNEWVDPSNPPVRACLTTQFWRPGMLVEVMVTAALR